MFCIGKKIYVACALCNSSEYKTKRATYFVVIVPHGGQQFHIEVFFAIYINSMQMRCTIFGNNNFKI